MFLKNKFLLLSFICSYLFSLHVYANFHEVELHSTRALLTFSEQNTINLKGNYLLFLDNDWQLLFGAEYDQLNDDQSRMGLAAGAVYNFGAPDHNEKYYIKPHLIYANYNDFGTSESVIFLAASLGKRIPIFKNDYYCINYTPSVGVAIPLSNTDTFDTVFTLSLVGLSLVFK